MNHSFVGLHVFALVVGCKKLAPLVWNIGKLESKSENASYLLLTNKFL